MAILENPTDNSNQNSNPIANPAAQAPWNHQVTNSFYIPSHAYPTMPQQVAYPPIPQQIPFPHVEMVTVSSATTLPDTVSYPRVEFQEHQPFLEDSLPTSTIQPIIIASKPKSVAKKICIGISIASLLCICCCCFICCIGPFWVIASTVACSANRFTNTGTISLAKDLSLYNKLVFDMGAGNVYFTIAPIPYLEVRISKYSLEESEVNINEVFVYDAINKVASFKATTTPSGACANSAYNIVLPSASWLQNLQLEISTTSGDIQNSFSNGNLLSLQTLKMTTQSGYISFSNVRSIKNVMASSTSGTIYLNYIQNIDTLLLNTDSGYIRTTNLQINGPTQSVKAYSSSGTIKLAEFISTSSISGLLVQTNSGSATVAVPSGYSGQYSLQTETGSLRLFGSTLKQKSSTGSIGGGSSLHQITMRSTSGTLKLDQDTTLNV